MSENLIKTRVAFRIFDGLLNPTQFNSSSCGVKSKRMSKYAGSWTTLEISARKEGKKSTFSNLISLQLTVMMSHSFDSAT